VAGGALLTCTAAYEEDFENGYAAVGNAIEVEVFPNRTIVDVAYSGSNGKSTNTFDEIDPVICVDRRIDPEEVELIPPADYEGELELYPTILYGDERTQIQLPLEAYAIPGVWEINVDESAFSLSYNVMPVEQPMSLRGASSGMVQTLSYRVPMFSNRVLLGYPPHTRIAVLADNDLVFVETDANGSAVIPYVNSISGLIPEDGNNIEISPKAITRTTEDGTIVGAYVIPSEMVGQILHNSIWRGSVVTLQEWTCPNAQPIRLSGGLDARVIADEIVFFTNPDEESDLAADSEPFPLGTVVHLDRGVECGDDAVWWFAYIDSETFGWLMESQNGEYLLEPLSGNS
jgi:hypothetical protein